MTHASQNELNVGEAVGSFSRALVLAFGILLVQVGAGLPASMYPFYKSHWNLTPQIISMSFVLLIFGILLSLALVSQIRVGKPVALSIIFAAFLSVTADLLFASIVSFGMILFGSLLQGIAIGLFTGLVPDVMYVSGIKRSSTSVGSLVAAANAIGLAAGPFLGGFANEFLPFPNQFVYWAHALIVAGLAVAITWASRPYAQKTIGSKLLASKQIPSKTQMRAFVIVAIGGFCAFAVGGLYSTLGSLLLSENMKITQEILLGLIVTLLFSSNAIFGSLIMKMFNVNASLVGTIFFSAGLVGVICSLVFNNSVTFFLTTIIVGAGQGAMIASGTAFVTQKSEEWGWSKSISRYFFVCYMGTAIPAFAAGSLASFTSLGASMIAFCGFLVVGSLGLLLLRKRISPDMKA